MTRNPRISYHLLPNSTRTGYNTKIHTKDEEVSSTKHRTSSSSRGNNSIIFANQRTTETSVQHRAWRKDIVDSFWRPCSIRKIQEKFETRNLAKFADMHRYASWLRTKLTGRRLHFTSMSIQLTKWNDCFPYLTSNSRYLTKFLCSSLDMGNMATEWWARRGSKHCRSWLSSELKV